ncbi:31412_t:CDS:2 [Gigaspora margarita]|uniref:31412_t:CDS:1 n=1 Tax=Gigaspora margarita TaxID=4874 RepID=A0ABN7UD55_GIGMA|nr:31412_t:CDS:2 [Gigaspora margarita]
MYPNVLRPILEEESIISSFGGTYINIFNGTIIVNTVVFSKVEELLALPQITPYNHSLDFKEVNNSLNKLKNNFGEISWLSKIKHAKNLYILTDMEYNNIVLYFFNRNDNNTEFLDAAKPFNPAIFYFDGEETPQTIIRPRLVLHGIHVAGGAGLSVAEELEEQHWILKIQDLVLYLGNS